MFSFDVSECTEIRSKKLSVRDVCFYNLQALVETHFFLLSELLLLKPGFQMVLKFIDCTKVLRRYLPFIYMQQKTIQLEFPEN